MCASHLRINAHNVHSLVTCRVVLRFTVGRYYGLVVALNWLRCESDVTFRLHNASLSLTQFKMSTPLLCTFSVILGNTGVDVTCT